MAINPNWVTDPVCKMQIEKDKAEATTEYQGEKYHFCCQACKDAFEQNPEQYVAV